MEMSVLYDILVAELGYSEYEAKVTVNDLATLQEQFQSALKKWVATREETEIVIESISSTKLIQEKKFTYPAALIALDWVATDPETAIPVLTSDIRQ